MKHEHSDLTPLPTEFIIHQPRTKVMSTLIAMRLRPLIPDTHTLHTQLRLSLRFADKVLTECERLGIQLTDESNTIDLPPIMREASMELGIHNHNDIERMTRWAYSYFLRITARGLTV